MNQDRETIIFDDMHKMQDFLIARWSEISDDAIQRRGLFAVALSGGSTPADFYRKLAGQGRTLPWFRTHIFLVDERFVPQTDKASNYRMIRETLLSGGLVPWENIHPISTTEPAPRFSAKKYEDEIIRFFGLSEGRFPEFDLTILGIGADGHTASLFPGGPLLDNGRALAAPVLLDDARHNRITLTLPVINNSRNVIFLVTGKEKAEVVRDVIAKKNPLLPASMVGPASGSLLYLLDSEAAILLPEGGREEGV